MHGTSRTRKWNTFCQRVVQDRAANELGATQARLGAGALENNDDAGDDDDYEFVETIDPLYY